MGQEWASRKARPVASAPKTRESQRGADRWTRILDISSNPHDEPLGVLNAVAVAAEVGGDAEIEKRLEEGGGEGEGVSWRSHNNHKNYPNN